jgi:conjugal transfer mating pair stabilization protein TraN
MKRTLAAALLLFPLLTSAADPAFNDGANFGKGNAGQGTGSLQNPGLITGGIPGYTSTPPESGYYGGVTGGDGGIGDKGQTAIGNNQAGGAIIDSGNKNPPVKIDPNAPFITIGKNAEGTAGSVVDGTNPQCTTTSVSKTTFDLFSCDRDVATIQTCGRTASITGHYEDRYSYRTITIDSNTISLTSPNFSFPMPAGTVYSASMEYSFRRDLAFGNPNWFLSVTALGSTMTMYDTSGSYTLPPGKSFNEGEPLIMSFNNQRNDPSSVPSVWKSGQKNGMYHFVITIVYRTGDRVWVPQTVWTESCGFNKATAVSKGASVCIDPGGTRTVTVDGNAYSQTNDCWGYSDEYVVGTNSSGNCGSLMSNPSCTLALKNCTQTESGVCTHQSETWQCQTTHTSTGMLCGGDYICKSGDCDGTKGAGDAGFDTTVAKLAGLASAGDDVKNGQNQMDVRAFTGTAMSCRKAFAGFNNCCKDSGWGQDTGLAACNSDEMAIGKAKAKKVTVSLGERCDHSVLGVCVQKSQVYCVFQGKLARIIQEQGRRDQLGVNFGSGSSPNCSGITVPQLQSINFDLINFSDFYEDLMANQKVPDSDAMVKQVKDRIAAQVNAQGGGK